MGKPTLICRLARRDRRAGRPSAGIGAGRPLSDALEAEVA
jgi:hypothetical protein